MGSFLNDSRVASSAYNVWYLPDGDSTFLFIGQIDPEEGIRIRRTMRGRTISVNALGEGMPTDWIYQGEERFISMTIQEANYSNAKEMLWDAGDNDEGLTPFPGSLAANTWGGQLKLEPVYAATPSLDSNSETAGGDDIIWYKCVTVAPETETAYILKADLLTIPVTLQAFPYVDVSTTPDTYRFWEYDSSVN